MSPSSVLSDLTQLCDRVDGHDKVVLQHAVELIEQYGAQLKGLKWIASQRFRASSEKIAPGQLAMAFIEHLISQAESAPEPAQKQKEVRPPRTKRKSKIDVLPVKQVDKTLPEGELQCACGACKQAIGYDVRRHIVFEPAKLSVLEERLWKYACKPCGDGVVMASGTPKLVEGSLASASMLAHLTTAKVIDCTPVERIGKQLSRHGADIAPSTLYDWFAQAGRETLLLQPAIEQSLLTSQLISLDDTPLPAKNMAHAQHIQRGRLWLYLGDIDRIAYCRFSEDWKGKHPRTILDGFAGDIQSDGYGGIAALFLGTDAPRRFGCNDHARRRFYEALKLGDSRAEPVIALYARVYAVEREATQAKVSAQERLLMRQQTSLPAWREMADYIATLDASPKGPMGKALTYWTKQQSTLVAFLDNGHVPISNAHVERLLRTVALLRKNALFVGSLDAGERYAALLTMALNCALCGANPFEYFTWLYERMAEGIPASRVLDFMPQAWIRDKQVSQ